MDTGPVQAIPAGSLSKQTWSVMNGSVMNVVCFERSVMSRSVLNGHHSSAPMCLLMKTSSCFVRTAEAATSAFCRISRTTVSNIDK